MCIAGLTKIVRQSSTEETIKEILSAAFSDFCEKALKPFESKLPIHFVGSVAFFFKDELSEALLKAKMKIGDVKKEAVFAVFDFLSLKEVH